MKHLVLFLFIISFVPCVGAIIIGSFFYFKEKRRMLKYLILSDLFFTAFVLFDILNYYFSINLLDYPESLIVLIIFGLLVISIGLIYYLTQAVFEIVDRSFNKFNRGTYFTISILVILGCYILHLSYKRGILESSFALHTGFFVSNIFIATGILYNFLLIHSKRERINIGTLGVIDIIGKILYIIMPASIILNVIDYNIRFRYPLPLSPAAIFSINLVMIYFAKKIFFNESDKSEIIDSDDKEDDKGKIYKEYLDQYNITERELEIIDLIVGGYSNQRIGEALFISPNTVKNHIYNIYKKTGIKNRYELISILTQKKG